MLTDYVNMEHMKNAIVELSLVFINLIYRPELTQARLRLEQYQIWSRRQIDTGLSLVLCWVDIDQKTDRVQDFSYLGKCSRLQGLYQSIVSTKKIQNLEPGRSFG